MARDDTTPPRDPEHKRAAGNAPGGNRGQGNGPRRGRSGYGLESIRPHLQAQLEQQELLRPTVRFEDPAAVKRRTKTVKFWS
jgi:hypothetical protein